MTEAQRRALNLKQEIVMVWNPEYGGRDDRKAKKHD